MGPQEGSLAEAIEAVQRMLVPLRQGEFSEKIGKISVYVQSSAKARDAKSLSNFIRFAHLNLDAVLVQALEVLVWRPRLASKTDEQKKAVALQKTFDRLENPAKAMLEHFQSSSDPLNKYLVAGPWGHEYLRKRRDRSGGLRSRAVRDAGLPGYRGRQNCKKLRQPEPVDR